MLDRAAQRVIFTACRHEPPRDARRVPVRGPGGLWRGSPRNSSWSTSRHTTSERFRTCRKGRTHWADAGQRAPRPRAARMVFVRRVAPRIRQSVGASTRGAFPFGFRRKANVSEPIAVRDSVEPGDATTGWRGSWNAGSFQSGGDGWPVAARNRSIRRSSSDRRRARKRQPRRDEQDARCRGRHRSHQEPSRLDGDERRRHRGC